MRSYRSLVVLFSVYFLPTSFLFSASGLFLDRFGSIEDCLDTDTITSTCIRGHGHFLPVVELYVVSR